MKRTLISLTLVLLSSTLTVVIAVDCGNYFQSGGNDSFAGGPCPTGFSKTSYWTIYFTDGHTSNPAVQVTASGACFGPNDGVYMACYPGFDQPTWTDKRNGVWNQVTHAPAHAGPGQPCQYNGFPTTDHEYTHNCNCPGGDLVLCDAPYQYDACQGCCQDGGGGCNGSPILIDVAGNGFSLTNALDGVDFDLDGDGNAERVA